MDDGNNIKKYSAADIEKYHSGQLSAKEMHALEKAALDDPFLADALEGYAVAGVNISAGLNELTKRLAEKTSTAKIVDIGKSARPGFPLMKIAAMIVVLAGAGWLVYQFGFNKNEKEIAQVKDKAETITPDTIKATTESNPVLADTTLVIKNLNGSLNNIDTVKLSVVTANGGHSAYKSDSLTVIQGLTTAERDVVTNAPVTTPGKQPDDITAKNREAENKTENALAKEDVKAKAAAAKKDTGADGLADNYDKTRRQGNEDFAKKGVANNQNRSDKFAALKNNYFGGRITDASNNAVPFANITNVQDNVGTYSDARGYFNLVSPDSVLEVQVRSVGFQNNQVLLRGSQPGIQVILQNDRSLPEIVISNKKPNAEARKLNPTVKVEEPEPADGWENYDTYLANNLVPPDEFKSNQSGGGQVKVSFEVDKNGEPVNIKVEKSLCNSCDQEAIRLIKDGPKWKRKARKGRTTVTVSF